MSTALPVPYLSPGTIRPKTDGIEETIPALRYRDFFCLFGPNTITRSGLNCCHVEQA